MWNFFFFFQFGTCWETNKKLKNTTEANKNVKTKKNFLYVHIKTSFIQLSFCFVFILMFVNNFLLFNGLVEI